MLRIYYQMFFFFVEFWDVHCNFYDYKKPSIIQCDEGLMC